MVGPNRPDERGKQQIECHRIYLIRQRCCELGRRVMRREGPKEKLTRDGELNTIEPCRHQGTTLAAIRSGGPGTGRMCRISRVSNTCSVTEDPLRALAEAVHARGEVHP